MSFFINTYLATAAFGLEGVVAQELKHLGFEDAKAEQGGARFTATPEQAFTANLQLRCADRVLMVLSEGEARSFEELFQLVSAFPWEKLLTRDAAFPVSGKCIRSQLMSIRDCQAITKKAIVERMKRAYRLDWLPETGASYPIEVAVSHDLVRLTLDTSGTALNRRGYRTWNGEAPLRETLAAALLTISPWRPGKPLYDPCCGTGTILIEAAMMQSHRAPGLTREFAMEKWSFVQSQNLAEQRKQGRFDFQPEDIVNISGSDIDENALELCNRHIRQAGMTGKIDVHQQDLTTLAPMPMENGVFLCNPPYGERLGDRKTCEKLYGKMRQLMVMNPTWRLCAITSDPAFERCFGKRAYKKRRLYNGRLECEFLMF